MKYKKVQRKTRGRCKQLIISFDTEKIIYALKVDV